MKSFIETQRALLAEIQNGCKRNFILAKEKEETDQKMRQSASMAEIATEDGTRAEEEESASEESQPKEGKQEEGDEAQPASESESSAGTGFSPTNLESDSDTEEEEEEEVVTNSSATASASAHLKQTPPEIQTGVTQPLLSASHTSSSPPVLPTGGLNVISGITVTETTPPPGTPPSPGRCISVSSPGRGRKIFMVTRVESPPEQQQQLQQQPSVSASPRQPPEDSKPAEEANTTTRQQTESQHLSPTPTQTRLIEEAVKENSPAPSSDSPARVHSPSHTHTLQPQSAYQPTEHVNTSTLEPDEINPSQQAPSQPSDPSPTQLTEVAAEPVHGGEGQHEEELQASEQVSADSTEAENGGGVEKNSQVPSQQQPIKSASEEMQTELVSATEEILSPKQTEEETEVQDKLSETSLIKSRPEDRRQNHQNGIDKEAVGAVLAQQQASSPTQSPVQESHPSAGGDAKVADPVALDNSPGSSADKCECSAEAVDDVIGSALPNGLKAEFSLHLLESESPKSGSCVMDHGELAPSPGFNRLHPGGFGICVC